MKPPPRTRNKPDRSLRPEPSPEPPGKRTCKWQRTELRKLLNGLRSLSRTGGGRGDIDYDHLRKQLPARSTAEIQAVVDSLKNKVISHAILKLKKKRWEEKTGRKPIEVWTHMASAVAGTLEEPITSAFSQMLIVSSTEPRTLRNCDPPQVHRPPADHDRPVGRTIPLRLMPRLQIGGVRPGLNSTRPFLVLRTPAPTVGPVKRLPALSKVVRIPNSKIPPPQQQFLTTAGILPAAPLHCPGTADRTAAPPLDPQPVILVSGQTTLSPGSNAEVQNQSGGSVVQTTQQHPATTYTPTPPTSTITSTTISSNITPTSISPTFTQATTSTPTPSSTFTPATTSPASTTFAFTPTPSSTFTPPKTSTTLSSPHTSVSSSLTSLMLPSIAPGPSPSSHPMPPPPKIAPGPSFSSSNHPLPPLSSPAAAVHARVGHTSKFATVDGLRTLDVRCIVDFERIYRYLSVVHQPTEECHLTPMESAIMLDLLMSLPEELPLLECTSLHKHLVQVYQSLSAPANSQMTREMFKDLKEGPCAQSEGRSGGDSTRPVSQLSSDRTDSREVVDGVGMRLQPGEAESQSSQSNTSSQSGKADMRGFCPPLNPFMVPLKMLKRRSNIN